MKFSRRTGLIIITAVIILAIVYGFLPKPVLVETGTVQKSYMRVSIEEEGKTRVMNRYVLSATVAGFALRIDLKVGDMVTRAQAVTELEPLHSAVLDPRSRAEAKARVAAARAALAAARENAAAARAGAELAEKELTRTRQLFEDALAAKGKLDTAEAEMRRTQAAFRSSEFTVEVAEYELEAALTFLKYSAAQEPKNPGEKVVIKSPVSGRVLKISHESEGVVREGEALIEIGDPRALEVEVDVLSADAVTIKPNTPVLFERWGGDKPLQGRVRIVEPAGFTKISALGVEEQRVLVISDITSSPDEWASLGDGYRVEAGFTIWEKDEVLQAPASALFRYDGGWAVFVMKDKKARLQSVKTGNRNGLSAEIVEGLSEGDIVITHPDSSIKDGTPVKLRK